MQTIETNSKPMGVLIRYSPNIPKDDVNLIFEFFIVFSRFEYALKTTGFLNNDRGYIKPDWREFARLTETVFYPSANKDIADAVCYYLEKPPKIQALINNKLNWDENIRKEGETDYQWVVRSIGIVRNNLFHGGKFPWEAIRDKKLLSHGLTILYYCIELNEDVSTAFKNP